MVLAIYRDDLYYQDSPDAGTIEIGIEKNKNGPTGRIRLNFIHNTLRLTEPD